MISRIAHWMNQQDSNETWETIIEDYEQGVDSRVLYYLLVMYLRLIPALISGTLPSQIQNPDFARDVRPYIKLRG